jgi:hypothetical protein
MNLDREGIYNERKSEKMRGNYTNTIHKIN